MNIQALFCISLMNVPLSYGTVVNSATYKRFETTIHHATRISHQSASPLWECLDTCSTQDACEAVVIAKYNPNTETYFCILVGDLHEENVLNADATSVVFQKADGKISRKFASNCQQFEREDGINSCQHIFPYTTANNPPAYWFFGKCGDF